MVDHTTPSPLEKIMHLSKISWRVVLILLLCVLMAGILSQLPLTSDLSNYAQRFQEIKELTVFELLARHYDKGYLLLNLIFQDLPFRIFLFLILFLIYLTHCSALFQFRSKLNPELYVYLALMVGLVIVRMDESAHFIRQYLASGFLLSAIFNRKQLIRMMLASFSLTLHFSIFPFVVVFWIFDLGGSILRGTLKKKILTFLVVPLLYYSLRFILTYRPSGSLVPSSEVSVVCMIYWILILIFIVLNLLDQRDSYLEDFPMRVISGLLIAVWVLLRFMYIHSFNASGRLDAYSSLVQVLFLFMFIRTEEFSSIQKNAVRILTSTALIYIYSVHSSYVMDLFGLK
jgi:hypothetical protein